jgi:hypothetical protein
MGGTGFPELVGVAMGKREAKRDQDRQDPDHQPQGKGKEDRDPDKPDGRHEK